MITNIKELREELLLTMKDVKDGVIGRKEASAFNGLASTAVRSAIAELQYNSQMRNGRKVDFLEVPQ